MEVQAFVYGLLLALCLLPNRLKVDASKFKLFNVPDAFKSFNCRATNIGGPINLTAISGYWYEVARIPNVEVLECLNVSVPAAIENNTLSLGLNYISTVNGGWQATRQTVDFPWDNSTQHGIFSLDYDRVTVTYKLVYTNNFTLAFVCGYSNFSPIPLFKLFTRQRQINEEMINFIKLLADKYGIAEQIAWEEQSPDKCNGSRGQDPLTILIGCIVLVWGLSVRKSVCI